MLHPILLAALHLHFLFADNMVLQRDAPVPVYGTGQPSATVSVELDGAVVSGTVAPDGRWKLTLPPFHAGGPHKMEVVMGEQKVQLSNLLFGDVWLASGQSNMAYKFSGGIPDHEREIASANFDQIRFLNVPDSMAASPKEDAKPSRWEVCSPTTVSDFSAVPYFFARDVFKSTGVPVGVITSAIGGTAIEAWMSSSALQHFSGKVPPFVDELNAKYGSWENYAPINDKKIAQLVRQVDSSMNGVAAGVLKASFDDSKWRLTHLLEKFVKLNRVCWLRKKITLTDQQASSAMTLSLAKPDHSYQIYINGKKLDEGKGKKCKVELPPSTFKKGKNVIVVRLASYWGIPRLMGDAQDVFLRSRDGVSEIPILTGWSFSNTMEPALPTWLPMSSIPSCLYNGMISPLLHSPIKGVIWYQGEQNTASPEDYAALFASMVADWRSHFGKADLPFYYVQLANFGTPSEMPDTSGWALLREGQGKGMTLAHTGMATAIDCGDPLDIHPTDKQTVGHRLALLARAQTYGEPIECYGPQFDRISIKANKVHLVLRHASGLKTKDGLEPKGFSLAGDDKVFYPAKAEITGDSLILSSDSVPTPKAVRYGFAASPIGNVYNQSDLPLYPFRTDDWIELGKPPTSAASSASSEKPPHKPAKEKNGSSLN